MSQFSVRLDAFRTNSSDGQSDVTPQEFKQLLEFARDQSSEAGFALSLAELTTLFTAARNARQIKYAVGQISASPADLKSVLEGMMADGLLSGAELQMLMETAIAPADWTEAGASVSASEADFFNSLDRSKMDRSAQRAIDGNVSQRLQSLLDVPARQAGVSVRGASNSRGAAIMPTGPRNSAVIAKKMEAKWLSWDNTSGFGSATVRVVPANFQIDTATPSGQWWGSDGISRLGSYRNRDIGKAEISQMPADGKLHLTMMSHPSGHNDDNGGTNSWGFSRNNTYTIQVEINGRRHVLSNIRNAPMGDPDLRRYESRGNEEYVTAQDITIDASQLKAGDKIKIAMWPRGTSQWGYSTQRVFELTLPASWDPSATQQAS